MNPLKSIGIIGYKPYEFTSAQLRPYDKTILKHLSAISKVMKRIDTPEDFAHFVQFRGPDFFDFLLAYMYTGFTIDSVPKMAQWGAKRHRKLTKYETWTPV